MTVKFNPSTHRYWVDGKPCPGVTTLLKGYPKPALVYWSAKAVAEFVADNPDDVSGMRRLGRGPMVAALKSIPWQSRDDAALRGTQVHELAAQVVDGTQVAVPERHIDLVQGYVAWLDANRVRALWVERPVVNRRHWYCGTFDLIADVNDVTYLLDVKTSRGVYGEMAMQLAMYAHAEQFLPGDDPDDEQPMPPVERYGIVHVEPGVTTLHKVRADAHEQAFRDALHAAWLHRARERVDRYLENPHTTEAPA